MSVSDCKGGEFGTVFVNGFYSGVGFRHDDGTIESGPHVEAWYRVHSAEGRIPGSASGSAPNLDSAKVNPGQEGTQKDDAVKKK